MKVPANPALIQNGMISVNETEYPILSFDLVPGKFTDPLKAKFNWTFVDFQPEQLQIQLDFEHLGYISSTNGHPDSIKLTIYGVHYFADNTGKFMNFPTILSKKDLPPMASKDEIKVV